MDRINLTDEDLAANKQGIPSHRQKAHLRQWQLIWMAGMAGIILIVVGVTAD